MLGTPGTLSVESPISACTSMTLSGGTPNFSITAEVIEKFGVPPDKVIEVQALIGDSTDNVPGVPSIGQKTAALLINEYGDLETLLKRAGEIKQDKRRQAIIDNADKARLSKKLVTLDTNVKLDVPIGDLAVHEPDHKRLIA